VLGAGLWGLASALAINAVARASGSAPTPRSASSRPRRSRSGVALLTKFGNKGPAFDALLFGSINGVAADDLVLLAGALAFAVAVFTVLYRAFLFSTFDPEVAASPASTSSAWTRCSCWCCRCRSWPRCRSSA
jgi:manganese/iron transport system permease protein/iron/zinc/copper transport system permease protein